MNKSSLRQTGSTHIIIVIIILVLIGALGFVVWNENMNKDESASSSPNDTLTSSETESNNKTYSNDTIGISFKYPKEWVFLTCDDNLNIVYFSSDTRGVGGSDDSQLCGGGSDFPPQMSFYIANGSVEVASDASTLNIDALEAKKSVFISDGDFIRPKGFEFTKYSIELSDGRTIVCTYNKWPKELSDSYDSSEVTKQQFQNLVESSLVFI
jgi:hypothetical protein